MLFKVIALGLTLALFLFWIPLAFIIWAIAYPC
jgi:hypothetical protein